MGSNDWFFPRYTRKIPISSRTIPVARKESPKSPIAFAFLVKVSSVFIRIEPIVYVFFVKIMRLAVYYLFLMQEN